MGKSAQVPLHVWLPDSMEGPTPISALIHAATMVTAGIFMVARMSPLFEHSETALSFVLVIGATTALFMGFLGVINNDIKRVVAYSTLSQLGYMTVALGASAYGVAIFHLMTHAFFKALLFLAAGSVIIGMHHEQDMRKMGGLAKYMPVTAATCWIGALALIGTPFFSGFYSKDLIIEAVHESHRWGATYAFWCVLIGVFVTALYTFRMIFMTFHGKPRWEAAGGQGMARTHGPGRARPRRRTAVTRDDHGNDHGHGHGGGTPHESPWVVTLPLVLLAIPSVLIGALTVGKVRVRRLLRRRDPGAREERRRRRARPRVPGLVRVRDRRLRAPDRLAGARRRAHGLAGVPQAAVDRRRVRSRRWRGRSGCSRTSTTSTGSTRTCWPPAAACSAGRSGSGGDQFLIDDGVVNGSAGIVGAFAGDRAARADRLPVFVCVLDGHRPGSDARLVPGPGLT